jgi:hypothetical protein
MLKKIILGTLFTGLIGVLVAGAVIRTTDRLDQVGDGSGQGRGRNAQAEVSGEGRQANRSGGNGGNGGNGQADGSGGGQGSGQGGSRQGNNQDDSRRGNGGNGQGSGGSGQGTGTGLASAYDWLTLEGTVVTVDEDALVIETADGELLIDGRAWAYALEQGFATQAGHEMTVTGFWEDGEFKAAEIVDVDSGESVSVRDQDGRPYWSGQGRGSGS